MVYREVCEGKWSWDAQIEGDLADRWKVWEESLPVRETVPRSLAPYHEEMKSMSLHTFGYTSNKGVCATVYAIVEQSSGTTQTLVMAKSRLTKKGLAIPKLELIGAHMATNLISNVHKALDNGSVIHQHCWLVSTVVLYWLQGKGDLKQFLANRVNKIQSHKDIQWHLCTQEGEPS